VEKAVFEKGAEADPLKSRSEAGNSQPERSEPNPAQTPEAEAERLKSDSPGNEPQRGPTVFGKELTVERLSEDHWLVLHHPIPQDADPQLLKAARAAAVVCRFETEDLMTHDIDDPHARDLTKIDAILTDIHQRLGEPEPEAKPLDPEIKTALDEFEKQLIAERSSRAQNPPKKPPGRLDRLIDEQDKIARVKQESARTERSKDHDRDR
jgi:hypothetical protein